MYDVLYKIQLKLPHVRYDLHIVHFYSVGMGGGTATSRYMYVAKTPNRLLPIVCGLPAPSTPYVRSKLTYIHVPVTALPIAPPSSSITTLSSAREIT